MPLAEDAAIAPYNPLTSPGDALAIYKVTYAPTVIAADDAVEGQETQRLTGHRGKPYYMKGTHP